MDASETEDRGRMRNRVEDLGSDPVSGRPVTAVLEPPRARSSQQRRAASSDVELRDGAETPSPEVGSFGRYSTSGEIARGGIGVILRGEDRQLGREVAIKVLREEHASNPSVVRRFLEEARIGGRLQHPGIVPVYELGTRDDERPYFAMKLVRGSTLEALLAERADASQDRRRFLAIFEQVCHTIAYAHSRGVIHRDLKPSNVMVGSFGEVQVVDWGLAKVLGAERDASRPPSPAAWEPAAIDATATTSADTDSVAGSVMGTPAYMPPEQAVGDIESLDPRCDVFALGAILCLILTGAPPYAGDACDVIRKAMRGDLEDARSRLAACGSDDEIRALAIACLSPQAAERPQNAGAVASAVAAYLASVDERERAAQIAAAEARADAAEERERAAQARAEAEQHRERAANERRLRRLTAALAATILGAILLAVVAWRWVENERDARSGRRSREIDVQIVLASVLKDRAAQGADAEATRQALEAVRRAESLAGGGDVDDATRGRVAEAVAVAESDAARVTDATARVAKAELLLKRGDLRGCEAAAREALALAPSLPAAQRTLAETLVRMGALDEAVPRYRELVRVRPDDVELRLGFARVLTVNELDLAEAVRQAEHAIALDPEDPEPRLALGRARLANGDFDGATAEAHAALELAKDSRGARQLADSAAECVLAIELAPAYARGESIPASTVDARAIARACHARRLFATEARVWERSLRDPSAGPRRLTGRRVVVAAVLAGTGEGADADQTSADDRERYREKARDALRGLVEGAAAEQAATRSMSRPQLQALRTDRRIDAVREPAALTTLPPGEQGAWRSIWADVDAAIARADEK